MSKLPRITIVTPSYNQDKYLEKTILSVLNQNYPNLEYIIIDGQSTDDSLKIIKKYQKNFSYWQSKPDKGQADAINIGFSHGKGEIMCWLNSDDILLPNSLHLIAKLFSDFPHLEWLTSQSIIINQNDQIIQSGFHSGRFALLLRLGLYHSKGLGFIPQEGTFWRSSLWRRSHAKLLPKNYCLDFHLWRHFAKYTPLTTLHAPLAAFRYHPEQKTSQMAEYYREIHPLLPYIPKITGIFGRILNPLFRRICPHISFDKKNYQWKYYSGLSQFKIK